MMFKILVIQTTNNLSDERAEFLINDRRCEPHRRSSSAQHPGREEGAQGRARPRRLERQAREAPPEGSRWTVKYTKAKPREDGSTPPVDLAIPVFGYQNHISLDRGFGFLPQMERDGRRRL
jgi:hypothetical protein